jgi:glycosyltransferase involved in cell wall biosynthesis
MNKPIVSIVLGSYNRYQYLPLTIDSVRAELAGIDHEIIVVDGGSDDGSLQWLTQQKDIITIAQHNRGEWRSKPIERRSWGYFMNLAFKCAHGKYVCMISDDCLVVPGAIKNGIALFDAELAKGRNIGAVAFYWRDWSKAETYHVGCTFDNKMYVNHGMYLNSALRDVGYIDEDYFFYNADGDLCLKLWHNGYEVIDSPDSYIEHYPHANVDVRKTNYDRFNADLKRYFSRWEGIFYDRKKNNVGGLIEKSFVDTTKTGDLFLLEHQQVMQQHPQLFKKKSLYARGVAAARFKLQAVGRRISNFFEH